jgi:hypothetical protein
MPTSSTIFFDVKKLQEIYFSITIQMEIISMGNVNRRIMTISVMMKCVSAFMWRYLKHQMSEIYNINL